MPRPKTAPRKQPQQERATATVDAILQATARVLMKDGFDHASTNRIAEAAGVSIGSLYQYFPSKEALVAALIERHIEQMSSIVMAAIVDIREAPVAVAVRTMVEVMLRAHAVDPALHKVIIEQVPRVGRLDRVHALEERVMQLTVGYLAAHRDEITPKNLELAAFVVVMTIETLTHAAVIHQRKHLDSAALADEITRMVLRYLT